MRYESDRQDIDQYESFIPATGMKNRHLQTLYPTLLRSQKAPEVEIERFELDDGDFVDCHWHHRPSTDGKTPIIILFHGLDGSFRSSYIQGMMHAASQNAFASVLMHFRGCSGEPNRLARSYHSGDTADAKAWLAHLSKRYPTRPLFAVGYSLGGNMLLKMLGELKEHSPLRAAVSVSAPMRLAISAARMDRGFSKLYQYYLMRGLRQALLKKFKTHDLKKLIGLDEHSAKKLRSLWEFDNAYTGPIHGFRDAAAYYQHSSAISYLSEIRTDTLIIHALDDPFMTPEVLPDKHTLPRSVKLEISIDGGHVGFVGGALFKPQYWLEDRIMRFFLSMTQG